MYKKVLMVTVFSAILAIGMVGCGGGSASSASSSTASQPSGSAASSSASAAASFDGSAYSDTGEGYMLLWTPGGSSEDGKVPQVAMKKGTVLTQITIEYHEGDGSVCTVYVDGIENTKMNASPNISSTLTLQGDEITEGVHTVEMVKMEGDTPVIYKKAQYEMVY